MCGSLFAAFAAAADMMIVVVVVVMMMPRRKDGKMVSAGLSAGGTEVRYCVRAWIRNMSSNASHSRRSEEQKSKGRLSSFTARRVCGRGQHGVQLTCLGERSGTRRAK